MIGWFGRGAALIGRSVLVLVCLLLAGGGAGAAQPEILLQPGYGLMYDAAVMAAYQRPYAMNFEIWKPEGLPAGWYATFDGFPVAQVRENCWVYGQVGMDGALVPTDVLVGSVVPSDVPGLVRVAASWKGRMILDSPAFRKILDYRCDRMGILNDPFIRTAVAWSTMKPDLWVWLGDRWKRITPNSGEYAWQALKRHRAWIADELRRNKIWWFGGESDELADLARQWGMLWGGSLGMNTLNIYRPDSGEDGNGSERTTATSSTPSSESPSDNGNNNRGDWDVGED
ncbi:MAG: hypothetical protein K5841_00690 [Fretibacterium sp.]|nr:hypothetical protein [Fretibacterium sp.]